MAFRSVPTARFWSAFDRLSPEVQERAEKQYKLFATNPRHPSLQLKQVGAFWSVRVTASYRALAILEDDTFVWIWIGSHDDYERLIS